MNSAEDRKDDNYGTMIKFLSEQELTLSKVDK